MNEADTSGGRSPIKEVMIVGSVMILLVVVLIGIVLVLVNMNGSSQKENAEEESVKTETQKAPREMPENVQVEVAEAVAEEKPVAASVPKAIEVEPAPKAPVTVPATVERVVVAPTSAPVPVKRVKKPTEQIKIEYNPMLVQALKDIQSPENGKVRGAIRELSKQDHAQNRKAFDALCKVAKSSSNRQARRNALRGLKGYHDFSPKGLCMELLRSGAKDGMAYAAMDLAAERKYDGWEDLFVQALRGKDRSVRLHAIRLAGKANAKKAERELIKLARYGSDKYLKDQSISALTAMGSYEAISLGYGMLRSGNAATKRDGVRHLMAWEDDRRALKILAKYQNDAVVGETITAHLARYSQ